MQDSPTNQLISDTDIDEIVDKFLLSEKSESVERVVNRLVKDQEDGSSRSSSPKGELMLLEANSPVEEGLRIHSPSGTSLPLLTKGSYLAYRKPFEKLLRLTAHITLE